MTTGDWIFMITFFLVVSAAVGYLPARQAAKKGYNLWLFWLFAVVALVPAMIVVGLLTDKRSDQR